MAQLGITVELFGEKELLAMTRRLPVKVYRKAFRSALTKTGRRIARRAKDFAEKSKETGLLKKSIGSKVWTGRDGMTMGVVIGPRTGFRQAVVTGKKGRKKALSKKKTMEAISGGGEQTFRDPVKYAHLVEQGTKRVAARPFLRPALDVNVDVAMGLMRTEIRKVLAQESIK